jgi:hypothetical protein
MSRICKAAVWLAAWTAVGTARADVALVGQGAIPGDRTDLSGLKDKLHDGTPHDRLGAMGSSIAYTGKGNTFILVPDRGPKDGSTPYRCRFQTMQIVLKGKALEATLDATTMLTDEQGKSFVGFQGALGKEGSASLRLDPEGVRVSPQGTLYISDEYGPFLYEFDMKGRRLASLPIPARFQVPNPQADPKLELAMNKTGRVPNRGMEGLAITPDGSKLVGIMQSPLIQDGGRQGTNVRILEVDVASRKTREFLYVLDNFHTGVSEILAINDHEFLVLERDGGKSEFRKIFKIDLAKATDVSGSDALPVKSVPKGVTPVTKAVFLDFLDPRLGLAGPDMPVKIEGLAFGPDLADGRHFLVVTTDNDFEAKTPTRLFGFAVDRDDLPGYVPQKFGR